jgi:hypothetical protein
MLRGDLYPDRLERHRPAFRQCLARGFDPPLELLHHAVEERQCLVQVSGPQ